MRRLASVHPALLVLAGLVALAGALIVEALTDSAVAAVAVVVPGAAVLLARSWYVGDLSLLRRR